MNRKNALRVLACLGAALVLVTSLAGLAGAGTTTVPGTDITIPIELPAPNLPVDIPGTVEQVTNAVLPDANVPQVPQLPVPDATTVVKTVTTATDTVTGIVEAVPVPDLRGKIPALPTGVPSVSVLTQQAQAVANQLPVAGLVKDVTGLVQNLTGPAQIPQTGMIISYITKLIPPELANLPIVKRLLTVLQSLLNRLLIPPVAPASPTAAQASDPPPAATAAVAPTGPSGLQLDPAADDSLVGNTYDHLPYTGADFTGALISILVLAAALLIVAKFEMLMKARPS